MLFVVLFIMLFVVLFIMLFVVLFIMLFVVLFEYFMCIDLALFACLLYGRCEGCFGQISLKNDAFKSGARHFFFKGVYSPNNGSPFEKFLH